MKSKLMTISILVVWLLILTIDVLQARPTLRQYGTLKRSKSEDMTKFLEQYGYLSRRRNSLTKHSTRDVQQAVMHFQRMYNMPMTGVMDSKTMAAMEKPRCGMTDMTPTRMINAPAEVMKAENYYVPGVKWDKMDLTWSLRPASSSTLPSTVQRQAITTALKLWSENSGLQFTEAGDGTANLNMKFASGDHGDGSVNAFDGPGKVLAHAFFPDSGETHFDESEQWTDGTPNGINLHIVAAHELGHALGLAHSDVDGALMAPYYGGYIANYALPADDKQAIQSLYGTKTNNGQPAPRPTQPPKTTPSHGSHGGKPSPPPNNCTVPFRAITQTHDYRICVYTGEYMWRTSDYGLDPGFPVLIGSLYENSPSDIEAALFTWRNYYTFFFKGKQIWWYYGYQLVNQKTIETPGYPNKIQAVVTDAQGTIYIIQNGNCWTFNEMTIDITDSNPKQCSTVFPGAPQTFDSALRLFNDQYIYFFSGSKYHKYSDSDKRVLPGYPKDKAGPWFGQACGAKPFTPKK